MSDVKKRSYRSPIRDEQAAQTRRRICQSAVTEFSERGWAGTTVASIAMRAGVTPQAVHLAIGNKADLLIRAVEVAGAGDTVDVALAERPSFADVYAPHVSLRARLEAFAAATEEVYARAARLFLVLQEAAASDGAVAQLSQQAALRRLADHRRLAELAAPGQPAAVLDTLADQIWVLAGPAPYVDLVHKRGWSAERYRQWLRDCITDALKRSRRVS